METDTLIIGAGQAGLSVARYLKERGQSFLILEKHLEIGSSWRERYDSLVLDSFAKYSHLDAVPFLGDQYRQPTKNEVADYLKNFASHFDIKPIFGIRVLAIEKQEGLFIIKTEKEIYRAKNVVLATGPFQKMHVPVFDQKIPKSIVQMHSKEYRNPDQLLPGAVLVVGGGNSGAEIAKELATHSRKVYFSYTGTLESVTSSPFSQWLAYVLGLAHLPKRSLLGKIIIRYTKHKSVGLDVTRLLANKNIVPVGRFLRVESGTVVCERGTPNGISTIIWATGYTTDFSLLSIPAFDPKKEYRGITNIPGLYVLNIRWQWSKSSSHLAGVSRDAKYIAKHIYETRARTIPSTAHIAENTQ